MAQIYLIAVPTGDEVYLTVKSEIIKGLKSNGHTVILESFENYEDTSRYLVSCDIIVSLNSEETLESEYFRNELLKSENYAEKVKKPCLYIYFPDILMNTALVGAFDPHKPEAFNLISTSLPEITILSDKLNQYIQTYVGKKIAKDEEEQKVKELINSSSELFVTKTKSDLKSRELNLKYTAYFCYLLGLIAILSGIVLIFIFAANGLKVNDSPVISSVLKNVSQKQLDDLLTKLGERQVNWSLTVYFGIKSILILTLLIAASKYCFNLAKSFMIESLKVADRSHAISFGQFYLQVFNRGIEPSELKDVFSDWNINNQQTAFNSQKADDYDPKYLDKAIEIIGKMKGVVKND